MSSKLENQSARAKISRQKKASVNTETGRKKSAMGCKRSAGKCPLVLDYFCLGSFIVHVSPFLNRSFNSKGLDGNDCRLQTLGNITMQSKQRASDNGSRGVLWASSESA
jgi:hypothetical protein